MSENTAAQPAASAAAITPATVQHLAGLARISLSEAEIATLTVELGSILTNVAKVSAVATPEVPATSHPVPINNVSRPDTISDQLSLSAALQNAPAQADGMFKVAAILNEEQ